eukprot:scaffold9569_cov142-Isochrysis_galbana.AAC.1
MPCTVSSRPVTSSSRTADRPIGVGLSGERVLSTPRGPPRGGLTMGRHPLERCNSVMSQMRSKPAKSLTACSRCQPGLSSTVAFCSPRRACSPPTSDSHTAWRGHPKRSRYGDRSTPIGESVVSSQGASSRRRGRSATAAPESRLVSARRHMRRAHSAHPLFRETGSHSLPLRWVSFPH